MSLTIRVNGSNLATKLPGLFPRTSVDPTPTMALYTAAALALPSIVPYTLIVMKATNDRLHQKADKADSVSDVETTELLRKWKGMNYNRAIFALIGTLLGAVAITMS